MNVLDVRNAPANTIRFVNGVPGALVRTPGQVVNLGTGAFNTVGAVGSWLAVRSKVRSSKRPAVSVAREGDPRISI